MKLDDQLKSKDWSIDTGSTACVVLITNSKIYCANAGDSRAVLGQSTGKAIALSEDHKPDVTSEQERIEKSKHFVED